MHVYVSLLKQMAPEHLLATFAKVCAEIIAYASDGMLNTEDATEQAVLQVLILCILSLSLTNTHTQCKCFTFPIEAVQLLGCCSPLKWSNAMGEGAAAF